MNTKLISRRIDWIDLAKAYGIFLVFYGHFIESLAHLGSSVAFIHYKLIYSFHIPLFFILCGYVLKQKKSNFRDFIKYGLASRIIPVVLFHLLGLFIKIIQDITLNSVDWENYLLGLMSILRGYPTYNLVMWFLVCLFTVEIFHFFLCKYFKKNKQLIFCALLLFVCGWLITWKLEFFVLVTGITKNFWYIHEALVACSFYQFGIFLKNWKILEKERSLFLKFTYLVIALAGVLYTFNLNRPLNSDKSVVLMALSSHGNPLLFLLTAVVGSFFIIFLGQLTPVNKIMMFIGQNTLILLGINGVFFHFANENIATWMKSFFPDTSLVVFGICGLVTLVSLAVCIPCILFLNKFVPQLVGRPRSKGPLLKNLI